MTPDLVLLRALIDESPAIATRPGFGAPEAWIRSAESAMGPLAPSYRWWLAEYNAGELEGVPLAALAPPGGRGTDDLTAEWRLDGDRLCFYAEPGGDTYHFALDRPAEPGTGEEHAVIRRDRRSGAEEPVADSFAGFLTVRVARAAGLGDGPTPALARLWRSTPGVLLPDGVAVYGPQDILERNETYEVSEYQPDWVLIGDDSGGRGLFMRRGSSDRESVYSLDLGAGDNDIDSPGVGEWVTDDLLGWLAAGTEEGR
ncbi:SMI1/KNR4 family protein [Kitasatospora aureofaciens]|uniref:SMI1/KNR4 family protein n=1 Tax=Kitasatospora aureofaciens TaxID=1894 RepID=UPI001C485DBA|nr:SMI1/KNR4 family protein [Kitasatospora aureofaciens]MBV6703263.1 SMI1/KNR4 family protein [Kitasatospora aureofaciens]